MSRTSDRFQRLRAVFDAALLVDSSVRESFVLDACASDPDLALRVMRLLAAHEDSRSFLEAPSYLLRSALRPEELFSGTSRFRVIRRLGAGGMGAVYEVHDRIRDEVVALKTFLRTGPADLFRLKREFRSLADVAHPNLVCLYELFVEDERCFFTMELVPGVSFVDYVRNGDDLRGLHGRLVPALAQLIAGVAALHSRGKLHRDIKPSNVLVTAEGRVVILDFGLTAELLPVHPGDASYVRGGTPAYMSPEEATGAPPSEAGDWYSVGVTLYEALTGAVPFVDQHSDLQRRQQTADPAWPTSVAPDAPPILSEMCMALLSRDPDVRVSVAAALRASHCEYTPALAAPAPMAVRDTPFVGRDAQLDLLNLAFETVGRGRPAAVSISGPSGIGKSALVRQFLGRAAGAGDAVVLSGRCYENESVPFKAVDGVVDALSRHLASMPRHDVERLLPPDVAALTRVFPVLLQVPAIAAVSREHHTTGGASAAMRLRAFDALRALLGRVAAHRALVVSIDDLQWADADSAVLLEALLRSPGSPAMLTLLSFRSEETAGKPFLRALLERAGREAWSAISLEPLTQHEANALIGALLPAGSSLDDDDRRRLTSEARGSPFVLEQLARYAGARVREAVTPPTFADMFATRLESLSTDARNLLATLAICGRPMAFDLVCDACGVTRERQSLVATLRAARFIRSSGSSERIEPYHDRIREVLTADVPPDTAREIHRRMAAVLVGKAIDDAEALFEHYHGAGDSGNAAIQAGLAGGKASASLAFDRAASFYQHALALAPASAAAGEWREGAAAALANAGRPGDAAEAYLHAADGASRLQRVELQRRGAEQFLIGGQIDRGLELIRAMLADLGMSVPRSPKAAVLPLLWRRARLRCRGLRFVRKTADAINPDTLLRLDACWSATTGLLLVDMIGAVAFSARHVLIALEAGEPYRLARALAMESVARAVFPGSQRLNRELIQRSRELSREVGHPHALALSRLADAMMTMALGEWKKALQRSEEALGFLRDHCVGVTWELNMAQNLVIWALMYLGELGEVSRRVPALLASARSSGNLYLATELCTRSNYVWLAADDPDEGERVTLESIARWSHTGFHRQHYSAILARIQTALYRGDAAGAWRLLADLDRILKRSRLTRVQVMRVESHYLRARSALAMTRVHGPLPQFRTVVDAAARRIAGEHMPWSDPIALLLEATLAHLEGRKESAVRCLRDAASRFDRADMNLYAAATRRRLGELLNDAEGGELRRRSDAWMAAQSIRNPLAMTRTLAPGFPDFA